MYSSKNSLFTPIYLARYIYKIHSFFLCMLCILFLSGCQKHDSPPSFDEDVTIIATEAVTPTIKPTSKPTPTVKPSASVSPGEELTIPSAQLMIEKQIDSQKYTVSLLTEDLTIDSIHYIAFLANERNIPLEPVLLVNKANGIISCLSLDGQVSAFNMYSLTSRQQLQDTIDCDWNGLFYCKDKQDHVIGSLQITQNDSNSFEFILKPSGSTYPSTIAGIGHITGNNAFFSDETDHSIAFTMNEDTISIYDVDEEDSSSESYINGDYIFQDYEIENKYSLDSKNAINLLNSLTTIQTKLPAPLSDYTLRAQDLPAIVDDRICYVIDAFAQLESNDVLMTTFFVSVDGSVIFSTDDASDESYSVIAMY